MLRLLAFLALLSASPAAALAQGGVDPVTASIAARLQVLVGEQRGSMRFIAVRGDDRSVVIGIELLPAAHPAVGPAQIAPAVTAGLCTEPGAAELLFGDGRTLRFEVARNGRLEGSVTIDRCPPHSGEGTTAASFAAGMQSVVGVEVGGGTTISGVRAEGNTVIMTVSFPPMPASEAPALAESFLGGFCRNPEIQNVFFAADLTLRIDVVLGRSAPVPGRIFTSCPGR